MGNKKWTEENKPVGIELGYPECCVKEFCDLSPRVMATRKPKKEDQQKLRAAHIGDKYTGFIPCAKHAKQINRGEITLAFLVTNRASWCRSFPNEL